MNTAKVTDLRQHLSKVPHKADTARLDALSRRFVALLPALLDEFFVASDDFLFRLAEKTTDGFESGAYFDSLRALRLEKNSIREAIIKGVKTYTDEVAKGQVEAETTDAAPKVTELSLIEDDTLERGLAIDSFTNRILERSGDQWLAFRERLGVLTGRKDLNNEQTPFNPEVLGRMAMSALEGGNWSLKTTLLLFRLFDQKAVSKLLVFYQSNNNWLIEEGILPNLKLINASTQNRPDMSSSETFEQLGQMLSQRMYGEHPGGQAQPGGYAGGGFSGSGAGGYNAGAGMAGSGGQGVMVAADALQALMGNLTRVQAQASAAPVSLDLGEMKLWAQAQAQQVTAQVQGTQEAGTVSLVAMLFEYILDDQKLSAHMKQLMARMQIPIIKVALLDKEFFTESEHSARLLLNRMARAATGWQPDEHLEDDVLLDGMERIVTRLNHEFESDLTMFDSALSEFDDLKAEYDAVAQARVSPMVEAEETQFKEHQNQDRARLFMEALLEGETLPEDAEHLLKRHWYRLMRGIYTTHGEGKAWKTSARIARELVWSLQPNIQVTESTRFARLLPNLRSGLHDGLKALGLNEGERDRLMSAIDEWHQPRHQPLSESVWADQERLDAFTERSARADELVEQPQPLPVDEPVIQHKPADLTYYMDMVETFETGAWFDIENQSGKIERGCLTAIVGMGSKYIFTDHQSNKVAERSAIGLAMALRNDGFRLVDDAPLFDRMIDTLVSELGEPEKTRH
ncbi:DUF1631 family protein [Saccharospirillum impatiens]|uniref:DUF1631 family protein n=1 Tax=Saccharospirillum impatiens TaxID=169438 RepID=UPI000417EF61|nr:DUF1631 family protein [Saccharospirillum impatiens]